MLIGRSVGSSYRMDAPTLIATVRSRVEVPTLVRISDGGEHSIHEFPQLASPHAPEDKRGFAGAAVLKSGELLIASWDRLTWIDSTSLQVLGSFSHPWFSDLHSVQQIGDSILVCSTNLSAALQVSAAHVDPIWSWTGWHLDPDQHGHIDYRELNKFSSTLYGPHIAGIQIFDDLLFVSIMQTRGAKFGQNSSVDGAPDNLHTILPSERGALLLCRRQDGEHVRVIHTGGLHEGSLDPSGSAAWFPEYFSNSLIRTELKSGHTSRIRLPLQGIDDRPVGEWLTRGILWQDQRTIIVAHPPRRTSDVPTRIAQYRVDSGRSLWECSLPHRMSVYALCALFDR